MSDNQTRPDFPTVAESVFENLYAKSQNGDHWNYATSPLELQKYRIQRALLGDQRYRHGLELACSVGVFTAMLAQLCDRLDAVDIAPTALENAKTRCAAFPWVRVEKRALPAEFPTGQFDLITFAEFGFFLSRKDLAELADHITGSVVRGGRLLLTHHMGGIYDPWTPSTGEEVHRMFTSDPRWLLRTRFRGTDRDGVERKLADDFEGRELYRVDLLERR